MAFKLRAAVVARLHAEHPLWTNAEIRAAADEYMDRLFVRPPVPAAPPRPRRAESRLWRVLRWLAGFWAAAVVKWK